MRKAKEQRCNYVFLGNLNDEEWDDKTAVSYTNWNMQSKGK